MDPALEMIRTMRRTGRTRTALPAILAMAAMLCWLAGPIWADCCKPVIPPAAMATPMPGCHGESAPEIHPACCGGKEVAPAGDCCGRIQAAAPATATPTAAPAPLCAFLSPTPAEPVRQDAAPVRPPALPPPIHADVGLYTLHAVFLI
jgi:hypothetical protein